jgi:hypothetical protein
MQSPVYVFGDIHGEQHLHYLVLICTHMCSAWRRDTLSLVRDLDSYAL